MKYLWRISNIGETSSSPLHFTCITIEHIEKISNLLQYYNTIKLFKLDVTPISPDTILLRVQQETAYNIYCLNRKAIYHFIYSFFALIKREQSNVSMDE